jgi:hypothetical protein
MKTLVLLLSCISLSFFSFNSFAQDKEDNAGHTKPMVNTATKANIHCITPPLGFDTLQGFNGWYSPLLGASIVVSYVEGKTAKDADAVFNDQHIANIKSKLLSRTWYTLDDGKELLVIHLTYEFNGETWGRFQAFVSDEKSSLWFVVSYPYKYSKDIEGVLLKSLRSVKFDQR